MSQITQVRSIIQDQPLYQKEIISFDGLRKSVQTYFFPILGSSVIITGTGDPSPSSIDEQNGLITFATPPVAQDLVIEYKHLFLLDSTIQDFIDMETSLSGDDADTRLVAAHALDAMADQQAMILKKIKMLDFESDGPALAKSMRDHAASLRKLVYDTANQESAFDIGEPVYDPESYEERVLKNWMRSSG